MKSGARTRCLVPLGGGTLFVGFGIVGVNAAGPHPVAICLGLIGVLFVAAGIYYGVFRLEFRDGRFLAHPGKKRYGFGDVASWKFGQDTDATPGHQRHLELRFDRWYRRYLLFEEEVSSPVFEEIFKTLREKRAADQNS
ncbi:MAG: hypothetical protein NTV51_06985 [Verrucomicrobia bacterium]|nr:hypothetical protein [Verrucomicrobiota bacterium]